MTYFGYLGLPFYRRMPHGYEPLIYDIKWGINRLTNLYNFPNCRKIHINIFSGCKIKKIIKTHDIANNKDYQQNMNYFKSTTIKFLS